MNQRLFNRLLSWYEFHQNHLFKEKTLFRMIRTKGRFRDRIPTRNTTLLLNFLKSFWRNRVLFLLKMFPKTYLLSDFSIFPKFLLFFTSAATINSKSIFYYYYLSIYYSTILKHGSDVNRYIRLHYRCMLLYTWSEPN